MFDSGGVVLVLSSDVVFTLQDGQLQRAWIGLGRVAPGQLASVAFDGSTYSFVTIANAVASLYQAPSRGAHPTLIATLMDPGGLPFAAAQIAPMADGIAILGTEASGSNFSTAVLGILRSGDAQFSLTRAPVGGDLTYGDGALWIVGGVMGDQVFRSVDGTSWTPTRLPVSAQYWSASAVVATKSGIAVAITSHTSSDSEVTILTSSDAGQKWQTVGTFLAPLTEFGTTIGTVFGPDGSWTAVFPDGSRVIRGGGVGSPTSATSPNGLPGNVDQIARSSQGDLVSIAGSDNCPSGKDSCTRSASVFVSSDNGQTWTEITPAP
ncbi:MAG: hypothetical protein HYX54_01235 [Chloroflexi bacterium]|nr:hypothetical protein [Chloroflexota bacterium]